MPPLRGRRGKKKATASSALDQALASASQAVASAGKKTTRAKTRAKRPNVWESDAARPGGKTSMDVLMAWLTAEGNYARWANRSPAAAASTPKAADGTPSPRGKRGGRASLIREVLAAFEAEGIHRTMQDVRNRVSKLEREYEAARKWLRETGFLLAFERGVADKDVERSVLRLCKYYRELTPRFKEVEAGKPTMTIDLDNTTDDNEDAGAQVRGSEGSGGVSPAIDSDVGMDDEPAHREEAEEEEEEHEHEGQEIVVEDSGEGEGEEVAMAEHEEHADASDASRSSSRAGDEREEEEEAEDAAAASSSTSNRADNEEEGEGEQEDQHYEQAEESEEEEEEEGRRPRKGSGGSFKRGFSVQSPKPKRRRLSLRSRGDSDEYQGDSNGDVSDDDGARHRAVLLASAEEERDQRRELFELERAKLQRELELKEIQVAFEKTLARKKLLDAGVLLDEIDRVLPL